MEIKRNNIISLAPIQCSLRRFWPYSWNSYGWWKKKLSISYQIFVQIFGEIWRNFDESNVNEEQSKQYWQATYDNCGVGRDHCGLSKEKNSRPCSWALMYTRKFLLYTEKCVIYFHWLCEREKSVERLCSERFLYTYTFLWFSSLFVI